MKDRKQSLNGEIDIARLERILAKMNVSPKNTSIILDAAATQDYDKALAKLDFLQAQPSIIDIYIIFLSRDLFINAGAFQFLVNILKGLVGEGQAYKLVCYHVFITDEILSQLNNQDAIVISICSIFFLNFTVHIPILKCTIRYLLSRDVNTLMPYVQDLLIQNNLEKYCKILLISILINQKEYAKKFNFEDMIIECLAFYCDLNVKAFKNLFESFDYQTEEASQEHIDVLCKITENKANVFLYAIQVMCVSSFKKSKFLASFAALYLTNLHKVSIKNDYCVSARDEVFQLLNVDANQFLDYVKNFENAGLFLIQSNEKFIQKFKNDKSLNNKCILKYIENLELEKIYLDFITGKANLSNKNIDFDNNIRGELMNLSKVRRNYIELFGENEYAVRLRFIIDLMCHNLVFESNCAKIIREYNMNDYSLTSLFESLEKEWRIDNFSSKILSEKPDEGLDNIIAIYTGKTELIKSLMQNYEKKDKRLRFMLVMILGDNLDVFLDDFLSLKDSSKFVQNGIAKVYRDNPEFAQTELIKLKDKKLATRKSAFNLIRLAFGNKFDEQIEEALNVETNEKFKLEMQVYLNKEEKIDDDVVDVSKTIETLLKSRKKVAFATTSMPEVHDLDGNVASEDYLTACLVAYANEPIAGVSWIGGILTKSLNKKDLEVFAQQVYYNFLDDGGEAKKKWVLYFSSIYGGFSMVEILKSQIAKWADNSRGAIAAEATKALALNPASIALVTVDAMSRKYKYRQVKKAAADAMEFAAQQLNITKEQLSDRIVPDLGFDESMKIVFDYGNRKFDIFLNTALELEVIDVNGKKLKTIPAVGKTDDEVIASESLKRFKELKKQLKLTATTQRDRLEMALANGRKWTKQAYESLFVKNPIMHQFAISLVWGVYENGVLSETFRYMEDGSFNSFDEEEIELSENAIVGIVHPIEMEKELLNSWKEQLSDYEVVQPFSQLERVVYTKNEDEKTEMESTKFAGKVLNASTLTTKLLAQGFIRGEALDAGIFTSFNKTNDELDICAELIFTGARVEYVEDLKAVTKQIRFFKKEYLSLCEWDRTEQHFIKIADVEEKFYSEILASVAKATATSTEFDENWREA